MGDMNVDLTAETYLLLLKVVHNNLGLTSAPAKHKNKQSNKHAAAPVTPGPRPVSCRLRGNSERDESAMVVGGAPGEAQQ